MEDFNKYIENNNIIVEDFSTQVSKMDRSYKQNINKDIVALNNVLDEMDLTDILRAFQSKEAKYILFKCTWNIFKDRPHDGTQNKPQ